jgi:hypothetical protein|tara:strand:- start:6696 stop:7688 length:993 start_codon:yes stop_codon:yes gene_type:complete
MKFFDPKEEVLDIQLTQYGKRLLSKGKLKPMYYAFFDDDILYDGKAAGVIEDQNSIQERIKEDTPRMHTQHVYEGIQTNINQNTDQLDATYQYQSLKESEKILGLPLGESSLSGNLAPAWDVKFYHNELLTADSYITSSGGTLRIPQINARIEPETFISYDAVELEDRQKEYVGDSFPNNMDPDNFGDDPVSEESDELINYFDDDSIIMIRKDGLFLDVKENNTDYLRDNFDIEVYIMDVVSGEEKSTKKLYFQERDADTPVNPDNVEYWLDISVDGEIMENVYCDLKVPRTKKEVMGESVHGCKDGSDSEDVQLRDFYTKDDNDGGDIC